MHEVVRRLGLAELIDRRLHLLKIHLPYHESDHVLNLAYNALCEGTCLQDIELRRNDEVFLDALGARRIPDPTTAGDFCRRFKVADIQTLQDVIHEARLRVWAEQPESFFAKAVIDMDGTLVETTGQCKQGMDIAYDGTWGYHPLVLTLANTGEVLSIVNRSGNRPSHEGAAERGRPLRGSLLPRRLSARCCCAATRISRRASTWTAGTPIGASASSSATMRCPICGTSGGRSAGKGLEKAGAATAATRCKTSTASAAGQRQGRRSWPARVRDVAVAERRGGGV